MLKRDFDDQKRREVLETIYRQADSFKKILDNYMDLERLDATEGRDFKLEHTTLEAVLKQVVSDPLFTDRSADIKLISPERWPQVNVDIDRIRQVLMQLVSNAVNYSSAGGEIICRTYTDNDNGQQQFGVSITDNGPGLTPEELGRVGERFYRVDDSASVPGGGLGLALAGKILSLHSGRLLLESKKGEGTTVTLWLPAMEVWGQSKNR